MNLIAYRRRSPLIKREVRKFCTNRPLPNIWEIFGVRELPDADPLVEKGMLDFLKPKHIIRKVFSGWWVK